MKKVPPLFIIFSLICLGGWIAVKYFDIEIGYFFASVGHFGQAYFFVMGNKLKK